METTFYSRSSFVQFSLLIFKYTYKLFSVNDIFRWKHFNANFRPHNTPEKSYSPFQKIAQNSPSLSKICTEYFSLIPSLASKQMDTIIVYDFNHSLQFIVDKIMNYLQSFILKISSYFKVIQITLQNCNSSSFIEKFFCVGKKHNFSSCQ